VGRGHRVRGLSRRPDPAACPGVEWVAGDLESKAALRSLVADAEAVVHAAGVVAAAKDEAFARVNAGGTRTLLDVLDETGSPAPLLLLSSLAAREPAVSSYAASKAEAERVALAGSREVVVVRPPAVYGPGDRATLPLWAQLVRGWLLAPRGAQRFSLIYVEDLARLLADLVEGSWPRGTVLEPDDQAPDFHDWPGAAAAASRVLRSPVRLVRLPRAVFAAAAVASEGAARWLGGPPAIGRGKVAELFQRDWCCRRATMAGIAWRPATAFEDGLAATLAWYRDEGRAAA
jgi:nucleoside-diphosphate-sugar epimerase